MIAAAAGYWSVMAITPGPNNVLLADSGLRFGLRNTVPLILGVQTGVLVQNLLVGAGLGAVFVAHPAVQVGLKVAGTLYVLWMVWRSWSSSGLAERSSDRPVGFVAAAAFQLVNPKSWLASTASVSAFLHADRVDLAMIVLLALVAMLVGTPCNVLWAVLGLTLKRLLSTPRALVAVNRMLAALLAMTAGLFWLPT
ncbi:LysE family translocator [Lysobacter korlensis]|uniref:LysE family translocator n=1 Tax=Lysobacter korlensis TaxID=553636 RepID=A0ABV6RXE5_9GAMM